jgi:hypothetical protein
MNQPVYPFKRDVRLQPKLPRADRSRHSEAYLVREGMITRLKAMTFFQQFKFSRNKNYQIQPQDVPYLGVYFVDESLTADGDKHSGEPRFQSITHVGFSVIIQNNDAEQIESTLDYIYMAICGLFTDPSLYLEKDAQIQSYAAGKRSHVFGATGKDNELPIAELQFTVACELGAITWEPFIPDVLETIHVKTVWPFPEDPNRQSIISEYDLEAS